MLVILSKLRSIIMEYHENPTKAAIQRTPWNKGQADRSEATASRKTRLVHPYQAPA